ncbi:uncharacterized protein LOC132163159 [Corylus avellana]|uniref:uncharacterized protein LOC132163159 n=1 Tax=Corylus avellana TaxID=13451 RepID=UPI00286B4913|nr:uncharacterized protein LOC132163159 [Corylus avellana]
MAVAADAPPNSGRGRKRKRRTMVKRKLTRGESVEVRSDEDGFQGSWHPATVIACYNRGRRVKYDHLLCYDGSKNLEGAVDVSPTLDGIGNATANSCNYRGCIRPPPPRVEFSKWGLSYGLCVDVFYQDAWWEGVIFDHDDGSDERRIFFPDLGDELKTGINRLRITQDWSEVTENWQLRGSWLFLEVIEEYEQEGFIGVSVQQIWYDSRGKKDFEKIRDWTCTRKDLWKKLVWEVIDENLNIILKYVFQDLDHSVGLLQETNGGLELARTADDVDMSPEADLVNSHAIVPVENSWCSDLLVDQGNSAMDKLNSTLDVESDMNLLTESDVHSHDKVACLLVLPSNPDGISSANSLTISRDLSEGLLQDTNAGLELARTADDVDMSPEADLANSHAIVPVENSWCSGLLVDQGNSATNRLNSTLDVETDMNLLTESDAHCHGKAACSSVLHSNPDGIFSTNSLTISGDLSSSNSNMTNGNSKFLKAIWLPAGPDILPGAVFCPSAVTDYVTSRNKKRGKISVTTNLRKHLLYLGWKIDFTRFSYGIRLRYTSPDGKCYYSLVQVCQGLRGSTTEMISSISDNQRSLHILPDDPSSTLVLEQPEKSQCPDFAPQTVVPPQSDVLRENAEFCPQAIVDYYMHGIDRSSKSHILRSKARMHLSAVGWKMYYAYFGRGRRELHYTSPRGKVYSSLRAACKDCMDGVIEQEGGDKSSSTASNAPSTKGYRESSSIAQSTELPEHGKVKVRKTRTICGKRKDDLLHLASQSFQAQHNLQAAKDGSPIGLISSRNLNPENEKASLPKLKRKKFLGAWNKLSTDLESSRQTLRSFKRVQQVVTPSSSHYNPRTVLSWLIDNNVVLPRAKVRYHSKKNLRPMAEGRITRKGIKCSCCQKVFTLSGFEVHAGRKCRRPAASIFLEDGRSLLDCQRQMIRGNKMGSSRQKPHDMMKGNSHPGENDHICTICHYGGELILCDQCPSAFHKSCISLKDVPDGDWFCPPCCCGICEQKKFRNNSEHLTDDIVLTCTQCEQKYHLGCLRDRGADKLENCPEETWFCCNKCEEIFLGLQQILGKQIPVGVDNMTWTLLKPMMSDSHDVEAITENYSKLNVALGVMHECFEPVKEPHTQRDLVEDVIFNRGYIHHMVYYGCLKLTELGVERLILPAISSVLNTWTTSFGFTKMTDSERLHFLDFTFLNFPDTVMCQKLLIKNPSEESSPTRGTQRDLAYENEDCTNLDVFSAVSEVYQTEQIDESRIAEQGLLITTGNNGYGCNNPVDDTFVMRRGPAISY